ncbi:CRISPR type III-A/MTUBE-associated protein Csm2 [Rubellimicrobium thermophilum DSM 16684]|uniref:CRISPR system Cms protein Csm2 n=1 Tax=Rubellimicrobium thermophilum DSM 16684 TaxID=1123069 RepID=S9SDL8_9RHOB|nr:type III-A CRISPR-associated protein Csm2 [Rubellimicrobium thermophilum]EPX84339.1 CRISPR type III-A/MTUBE-associated protein Csm2 [Rubellimicrobium thermophilum DSM 16684]
MARPDRYFTDDGKTPRPALFDDEAQAEARAWSGIRSAQIRRFFGQVMADRRRFELQGWKVSDAEVQVAMALFKAGAAYAAARDSTRKPLAEFAAHHAAKVKTVAEFRAFARHFEAVVAWHKVFEGQNPPRQAAAGGQGRR